MRGRRFLPPRSTAPGIRALLHARRTWRGDSVAGLTVAAYLVPQCMAYAGLAGLDPVTGLWTALPALVVYALLGTSSRLSVGPESASALLVGSAVATLSGGARGADPATVAASLALAVGVVAFVASAARLGFLADLLSRPVLVGYMAGVAVVMIISQLPSVTGIRSSHHDTLGRAQDVLGDLGRARVAPIVMGLTVLATLLLLQRYKRVPGALLVMVGATLATKAFDLGPRGIATVGTIPTGLPSIVFPSLPADLWPRVLVAAAGIFVVAFADDILTARAFARRGPDSIDANQELLALAGANAAAGVVGGFPVSSSGSRTAVVDAAGGRSQLVSVVAAISLAIVLLAAAPLLESFPLAALGGLVVYAGVRLIDVREMARVAAFRRSEAVVLLAAFAGVVIFDVLAGIGIAVALSVAELFARIARAHDAVQGEVPGLPGLHDVDDYPSAQTVPGLVVYRYDAPLCFANAEDYRARVLAAVASEAAPVEWVLLNLEANVEIDLTATDMLEELRGELETQGTVLAFARVKHDLAVYLDRTGLSERVGPDRIFFTLPTALDAFRHRHDDDR